MQSSKRKSPTLKIRLIRWLKSIFKFNFPLRWEDTLSRKWKKMISLSNIHFFYFIFYIPLNFMELWTSMRILRILITAYSLIIGKLFYCCTLIGQAICATNLYVTCWREGYIFILRQNFLLFMLWRNADFVISMWINIVDICHKN